MEITMAFTTAAGYGNLPNGNFSPIIYSKQVQVAFRKASIVEAITNSDYFGEIAQMGDSVKVIKEPEITVKAYARGTTITPQDLDDEEFSLTIDKANYFAFKVDDIEEAHSHVNFQSLASDRAAYRLADQFDQDVLGYLSGFTQSAIHGAANTVNTTVNGAKAVSTASSGSNLVGAELLASMSLDASDFTNTSGTAGAAIAVLVLSHVQVVQLLLSPALQVTHFRCKFLHVCPVFWISKMLIPKDVGLFLTQYSLRY